MSKRIKRDTYLTYGHKFEDAGPIDMNFGNAMKGAFGGKGAGAIGSAIGGAVGGLIGGGYQSGAGDVFNKIGDIGSAIPGPWGAIIGGGAKILGGLTNAAFGSKVDQEKLNAANAGTAALNSFTSNASSFDDVKGVQAVANVQDAYKGGWFAKSDARKKNEELRKQRAAAMSFADRSVENNIENIADEQMNNMLANYAAFGGPLHTNGADFSNGVQFVNAGGSHESNPLEGVPMGIAPDGQPNLVEEGEVIFNDYVFSKRLRVPKAVREKYKLRGTKDLTFADAAKKAQKESEERPNDPISKRGLEAAMQGLMVEQESIRQKKAERESKKAIFAYGGNLFACGGHKYSGDGDELSQRMAFGYGLDPNGNYTEQSLGYTYKPEPFVSSYDPSKLLIDWSKENRGSGLPWGTSSERRYNNPTNPASIVYRNPNQFQIGEKYTTPQKSKGLPPLQQIAADKTKQRTDGKVVVATDNNTNLKLIDPSIDTSEAQTIPNRKWKWDESQLRYVPAIGAGLSVLSDIFGWTNKPDYSGANSIMNAAGDIANVRFSPIGDYLGYRPFDRLFYANQLGAQSGATRRNIMNTSGGNRGAVMAGLLAADYNVGNQLGNLYRQAEEYNLGQRQKVAEFNRGTNQFNSEGFLKAAMANQQGYDTKVKAAIAAADLRDKIDSRVSAAKSANLTNFFNSIGDIGREAYSRNMINTNPALYYSIDRNGKISYRNGYNKLSEAEKDWVNEHARYDSYRSMAKNQAKGVSVGANGGFLTIRRKK